MPRTTPEILYVYAAAAEAGPLAARPDTLQLGIGKTAAAIGLTARLAVGRPKAVVAFGVAGVHRTVDGVGPDVGAVVVVDHDCLLDEGVTTPRGFLSLAAVGLSTPIEVAADAVLSAQIAALLEVPRVGGTTVSTCSGTDALATARWQRCPRPAETVIETMEGAAIGHACQHFAVPWTCVRAISNRTGDRAAAGWDLAGAAVALQGAMRRVMETL